MLSSERPKNAPAFSTYRPSLDIRAFRTRRKLILSGEHTEVSHEGRPVLHPSGRASAVQIRYRRICDPFRIDFQRSAGSPQPLRPNKAIGKKKSQVFLAPGFFLGSELSNYSMIFATTPAPTVRPPSRIAKRKPSSIAIGAISSTVILMLSPGITISVPSGSSTLPVTSVVRK